jgi:hypothetical protein
MILISTHVNGFIKVNREELSAAGQDREKKVLFLSWLAYNWIKFPKGDGIEIQRKNFLSAEVMRRALGSKWHRFSPNYG